MAAANPSDAGRPGLASLLPEAPSGHGAIEAARACVRGRRQGVPGPWKVRAENGQVWDAGRGWGLHERLGQDAQVSARAMPGMTELQAGKLGPEGGWRLEDATRQAAEGHGGRCSGEQVTV